MPASTRFILLRPGAAAAKPSERNTAASPPAKAHTVVPSVPEETNKHGKCRANAGPRRYPNDIRACQWIAENSLVHKARHAKTEPARQRHHGTGQAQYRKGAHCHSVPRQQCLQGYGITAETKVPHQRP